MNKNLLSAGNYLQDRIETLRTLIELLKDNQRTRFIEKIATLELHFELIDVKEKIVEVLKNRIEELEKEFDQL